MGLRLKPGVDIQLLVPQCAFAMQVANAVYSEIGIDDCTVTSGREGKHMAGSKHYLGQAFDLRIRVMTTRQAVQARDMLRVRLGKDFDVVLESKHIHVEYDVK